MSIFKIENRKFEEVNECLNGLIERKEIMVQIKNTIERWQKIGSILSNDTLLRQTIGSKNYALCIKAYKEIKSFLKKNTFWREILVQEIKEYLESLSENIEETEKCINNLIESLRNSESLLYLVPVNILIPFISSEYSLEQVIDNS